MAVIFDQPFEPPPTNADLAERLAEAGVWVFPCDANKRPLTASWPRDARCDLGEVARIWARNIDAMPAINLGKMDMIVIDPDTAESVVAFEKLCAEIDFSLASVPTVNTPSGGRHYYFRQRPGKALGNKTGLLPRKIDVRGAGGYTIAPGSWRIGGDCPDGLYELVGGGDPRDILNAPVLPEALHAILVGPKRQANDNAPETAAERAPCLPPPGGTLDKRPTLGPDHPRVKAWAEAGFEREIEALRNTGEGGRNVQLNKSAFAVYQLVGAGMIDGARANDALVTAAEACGLVKSDGRNAVFKTIDSGRRAGLAQPRAIPEEFIRDEELADEAVELNGDLVVGEGGAVYDRETGEVVEVPPADQPADEMPDHLTRPGGLLGEIVDWIVSTAEYPSRVLALPAAIAVLGTVIGRRVAGPTGSDTSVYALSVAPTGVGKGAPQACAFSLLEHINLRLLGPSDFTSSFAIDDAIDGQPLSLCIMDEFGAFIAKSANPRHGAYTAEMTKVLRKAWDGFTKYISQKRAQGGTQVFTWPAMSLLGSSTPDELFDALSSKDAASGFLNRFLIFQTEGNEVSATPTASRTRPPERIACWLKNLYDQCRGDAILSHDEVPPEWRASWNEEDQIPIDWDSAALAARYEEFKAPLKKRAKEGGAGVCFSRTAEYAVRLATIHAVSRDGLSTRVTEDDFAWGAGVAVWSGERMAREATLRISDTRAQAEAKEVLRAIVSERKPISHSNLVRKLQHKLRARDLKDILESLQTSGEVVVSEKKQARGPAGRFYQKGR